MSTDPARLARLRHELRTPLNHVIGYAEMLLEDAGEGPLAALAPGLRRILDDARQLLGLVNDALGSGGADVAAELAAASTRMAPALGRILDSLEALRADATSASAAAIDADLGRIRGAAEQLLALIRPGAAQGPGTSAGAAAVGVPARGRGVILVVDDDDANRDLLARRLAREGYEVRTAAGGRAALEALRAPAAGGVDLVLLDVMMPGIDGHEVLRRMKAEPPLRDLPVLMVSALDELDTVVRCIELGAEDYLTKPFEPVLLRARIGACLEKKRLRDQEVRHARELAQWNRTLERRVADQVTQMERLGRLKRFFSPQLAELIVAGGAEDPLRTHRREVTVVFLDLRGFTAFAETAEPEEVMGLLRGYHAEMGRLIVEHEGTLERFTGDGMMIFFNDPVEVPDPDERAVRMAVAMRERVTALAAGWRRRGHDLGLGIGIAQGYATIGAIGFEGRWDYGAIGTVTNLAARLCGEARPGQVLVSQRVAGAVEGVAEIEEVGALGLKGLARPVRTFNVLGLKARG